MRTTANLSYSDLHQIVANDQLPGKVVLRLSQSLYRRISGTDMAENQCLGATLLRNFSDILNDRMRG